MMPNILTTTGTLPNTISITGPSPSYVISDNTSIGSPYWYTNTITDGTLSTNNHTLTVKGDAEFDGDIKLQGKSLVKSLEMIEEKLAILHPNKELEEKWENLRDLRKAYMDLEAEIKEKQKVWDILQK